MALVLADRVQEYSTTTGTGTLTLSGAYAGFQTFATGIGNGNTCYYTITSDTNQWEVGIGTVGVGTLARTTLISSSTGSLVSFVGTLTVFVTYPAEKAVYSDGTTIVAPAGALLPVTSGGTGASTAAGARTALGLGTIATQAANSVAITGGAIDGTTVGSTTVAAGSFSTLNSSGNTRLGGLSGNQSLQVNNVASAVNYLQAVGAVTGGAPVFSAQGTDANIDLNLNSKGTGVVKTNTGLAIQSGSGSFPSTGFGLELYNADSGNNFIQSFNRTASSYLATVYNASSHQFRTSGIEQTRITNTASAVNYLQLTGAATGAAPTISAQGSDANIGLVFTGKGTGVVALGGSTVANAGMVVSPTTSSVNYVGAYGAAAGGGPSIFAAGAEANVSLVIQPKGTGRIFFFGSGGFQAQIISAASSVNYVGLTGASTGNPPIFSAEGSDANINLKFNTKGTGTLQFGTHTAGIIAQAGYITITDAGGTSRRLLVG